MVIYKPAKGVGLYYILATMILYNLIILLGIIFVESYILVSLFKLFLLVFNIYEVYYILLYASLKYAIDDENVYIKSVVKKYKISLEDIEGYKVSSGGINGIRLSGFGKNYFALGKSVIKNIGISNMFVTSNKNIIYLKSDNYSYAVSPDACAEFIDTLQNKKIDKLEWEYTLNKDVNLHKDKNFMIPFILVSIIITILTLNPFILYLMDKLPGKMPLNFDSAFMPVDYGKGKQFAFNQMLYGALNMAVLLCMYYASNFYAKYDKKGANKFIYISLFIALAFLLIQVRILLAFR